MVKLVIIVLILAGEKMVEIMVEDISKKLCNRCHRELKDKKSKELGFGPTCYKKYLKKKKVYLFEMEVKAK